ncbi:MAG: Gfo/Idh/MocA family oxidoreductase [Candidatus Hydrogenedentes bacterium]|nr:Gfo/Idh/MocA family oxidoreductase [Candidatus Hydrogenedentota bacterium]
MKRQSESRRTFLKRTAAAATVFSIVPRYVVAKSGETPPSEKPNIASIGAGGQAEHDIGVVSRSANIVALCDVDDERGAKSFEKFPDARKYKDFRIMLDKEAKNIDGVIVATPDHIHAVAALAAMELGKAVYVEKPMAHNICEVRKLAEAARKYKVITQMGNQGHSFLGCRLTKAWVEDDAIGDVTEVMCWTNRPTWPQGMDRPAEAMPVPATLDWDLWLGPAPSRPYNRAYAPHVWRGWWDFGTGALGDMGCHIMDSAYWALKLGAPTRVSAETSSVNGETAPQWSIIRYEFPKRGKMPPVTLTWHDGGKMPARPAELEEGRRMGDDDGGSLFIGTKGKIMVGTYGNGNRLIPESAMQAYKQPKKDIERPAGHHQNWIDSIKSGKPAASNFDYASGLTELVLLGNLAIRAQQPIEWDVENMKVKNFPAADPWINGTYREGWKV